jgi:hypothetical protein
MLAFTLVLAAILGGALRTTKAFNLAEPRYEPATQGIPIDTITGWVVDANDWLDRGFLGVRHKQAAVTSADLGEPLVILTDSGSIVYPVTQTSPTGPMMENVRLIPFAEQRIVVTGRVVTRARERGVMINGIAKAAAGKARAFPAREVANSKVLGRVAALSCWLSRADTGTSYVECARAHAEAGEPLILVTDSGYVYYPVNRDTLTDPPDFTKLVKYLEQDVVAYGTVITRGRTRAVVIDSLAKYTPIETLRPGDQK